MRLIAAYLLIWLLPARVARAREVITAQFRRLPRAMRGLFRLGDLAGLWRVAVNAPLLLWSRSVSISSSYRVSASAVIVAAMPSRP